MAPGSPTHALRSTSALPLKITWTTCPLHSHKLIKTLKADLHGTILQHATSLWHFLGHNCCTFLKSYNFFCVVSVLYRRLHATKSYRRVNQPLQNPVSQTLKSRHCSIYCQAPSVALFSVIRHVWIMSTILMYFLQGFVQLCQIKNSRTRVIFNFGWLSHIQLNTPLPIIQNTCNSSTAGKATCSAETAGGAQSWGLKMRRP